jgi:hypothetical protein
VRDPLWQVGEEWQAGIGSEETQRFVRDATANDYEHLLAVERLPDSEVALLNHGQLRQHQSIPLGSRRAK